MSVYLGIGDAAHTMSKRYVGIDDQARQVRKMYVGVDGQACLAYKSGSPIGNLAVGKTVKIAVGGRDYDWLVVHQGLPGSMYDASCNGTWLLQKDIYTTSTFGSNNLYKNSRIHSYLNGTFFNLIDADIRNAIKQVKIPYTSSTSIGSSPATGANGLSTKVFLLSGYEVGWTTNNNTYFQKDGVRLAYFSDGRSGDSKRVAYNGGRAAVWWLRSQPHKATRGVWTVNTDGSYDNLVYDNTCGVRPCMILPQYTLVDGTGV